MKIKQNNACRSDYTWYIKYYYEGRKSTFGWHHFQVPNDVQNSWGLWKAYEEGSVVSSGLFVYFYVFHTQGQAGCFEFPQEDHETEEDIGRALTLHSTLFWDHIIRGHLWIFWEMKLRVAGKVILRCQMFKYWPKESSTQFLVLLASMAPNETHNQFLPSVILGSEAYILFLYIHFKYFKFELFWWLR